MNLQSVPMPNLSKSDTGYNYLNVTHTIVCGMYPPISDTFVWKNLLLFFKFYLFNFRCQAGHDTIYVLIFLGEIVGVARFLVSGLGWDVKRKRL